jgi:hypothetical protein
MAKHVIWKRADGDGLEHLPALLESVASIYGDEDLSADEREAMLRATFDEYEEFTGRDGLADIASSRGETKEPEMQKNVDVGALAMFAIECAANNLRKADPSLSAEQAFSKAYQAPENHEAMKAERRASLARIAGVGLAQTEPEILNVLTDREIRALIIRERRRFPFLDGKELLEVVERAPEMVAHRAAVRQAQAAGRRDGSTLLSAAVTKRDSAHGSLMAKAAEIRRAFPALSQEQSYAKAYSDPANRSLVLDERGSAYAALYA